MKRKGKIFARAAALCISACISVLSCTPVYADSTISGSGSGETIVTFTVPDHGDHNDEFNRLKEGFEVNGYSGIYDGAEHSVEVLGVTENTKLQYSTDGGFKWTEEAPRIKDAEDSTTVYVKAQISHNDKEYLIKKSRIKISRRPVKITVNDSSKIQGEIDPEFSAEVSGTVEGETINFHIVRSDKSEKVGTYVIKAVLDDDYPNYRITIYDAYLRIKRSESSDMANTTKDVSVKGYVGYYDGQPHTVSVNIDSQDDLSLEYSTDGGDTWVNDMPYATDVADSTTVLVRVSNGDTSRTISVPLTIKKTRAVITAEDARMHVGENMPEFSATVDGVVGTEQIDYSLNAEPVNKAGTYKNHIKVTLNEDYPNYQIKIKNGTLTVDKGSGSPAEKRKKKDDINILSDDYILLEEPEEIIVHTARFEAPENMTLKGETKKLDSEPDLPYKKPRKPKDALPYVIGAAIVGAVAVGAGVSGGFSALWILLLGIFFKKRKKNWSGLMTYTENWAMKVKGNIEGVEDMQDILNKGVTTEELQVLMKASGVETILPVNTKMSIDIEGTESLFDADEEVFYRELLGKKGHCIVTFYNGAAKLNFVVTTELH